MQRTKWKRKGLWVETEPEEPSIPAPTVSQKPLSGRHHRCWVGVQRVS